MPLQVEALLHQLRCLASVVVLSSAAGKEWRKQTPFAIEAVGRGLVRGCGGVAVWLLNGFGSLVATTTLLL